jgi:hypothetical protein
MVGTRLVSWIEIPRLGGGLERSHDYPRRIGAQMQGLAVEKCAF